MRRPKKHPLGWSRKTLEQLRRGRRRMQCLNYRIRKRIRERVKWRWITSARGWPRKPGTAGGFWYVLDRKRQPVLNTRRRIRRFRSRIEAIIFLEIYKSTGRRQ